MPRLRLLSLAVAAVLAAPAAFAVAEEAPPSQDRPAATDRPQPAPAPGDPRRSQSPHPREPGAEETKPEARRLPPDATTKQTLTLPDRTLSFQATVGAIRLFGEKGEAEADVAFTAYRLDGTDPAKRPVTFLFNGGPGSASAWLQFGDAGPWRLAMSGAAVAPSAAPELLPNAETWLDFTDLVFVDPPGTGYSRVVSADEKVRKRLFSVEGDADAVALTIRRWLERFDRLTSPKYVVGESYGGIRGPKVVQRLAMHEGVGVRGLVLISPVLDFRNSGGSNPLKYVAALPTMAAVAREAKTPTTRADLAEVERYAAGDYLLDLVRGEADAAATGRIADRVAALTGIDAAVTRRLAGRLDAVEFRREFDRRNGRVTGRYDASVSGFDPYPDSSFFHFDDPSSDPLQAPLTAAAVDLTTRRLGWRPEGSYVLSNGGIVHGWDWGRGLAPPSSIDPLRRILAGDPGLKLLVGHGLFDLATPYFGTKIELDQLPAFAGPGRVKLVVLPGGHMFYTRDASRRAFRAEVEALYR